MNKKTEVVKDLLINGETIEPNGRSKFICECPFAKQMCIFRSGVFGQQVKDVIVVQF